MYDHVRGTLARKTPAEAVVDAGGVGYLLAIPLGTYDALPAVGTDVRLLVSLVVRDSSMRLFGFATEAERELFTTLQAVSGVGPLLALSISSTLTYDEVRAAVANGDAAVLRRVKGVGKRLSERLVLELRDRLGAAGGGPLPLGDGAKGGTASRDAVMALEALGHDPAAAARAVALHVADVPDDAGELVRRALADL